MKRYAIYHLRWQMSALIMIYPMLLIESLGYSLFVSLPIGQAIGAVVFYFVDKRIFR